MLAIKAILFDLDDTLLGNNMDHFLQGYFPLLADHARPFLNADRFLPELIFATQAMINEDHPDETNCDVFWRVFCQRNNLNRAEVEPSFDVFYRETFASLHSRTTRKAIAADLVQWCFDQGLKVVVATNPLFPCSAIEQRLSWAGVGTDRFDYDLITACENMHAAKPRRAYFEEILDTVGVEPQQALMVGDDVQNDIVPARQMGLYTYWLPVAASSTLLGGRSEKKLEAAADAQGTLEQLFQKLTTGWLVA